MSSRFVALVVCCLLATVTVSAHADLTKRAPLSPVMESPRIVNLFWDDNWDADSGAAFSRDKIDDFTRRLFESTPYLARAAQYGVHGARFGGSFLPHRSSLPGNPWVCPNKPASSINVFDIVAWVECEVTMRGTGVPWEANDRDVLYVVYLPKGTGIHNLGRFESCKDLSAYHSVTASPQLMFAVVPLDCNTTFNSLTVSASHEIVEALTDPTALQWQGQGAPSVTIPAPPGPPVGPITIVGGEAGDACTPLPPPIGSDGLSYFGIQVEAYFSNSDHACVVGDQLAIPFAKPLTISPSTSFVVGASRTTFSVSPPAPVTWSLISSPALPTTTTMGADGTLTTGNGGDYTVTLKAVATDGSGRIATQSLSVLGTAEVRPSVAHAILESQLVFRELHGYSLTWSVDGAGNGTISPTADPSVAVYTAPGAGPQRRIGITGIPLDVRRPAVHASIEFQPLGVIAGPDRIKPGGVATFVYGVCTDAQRRDCISVPWATAGLSPTLAPHVGELGNLKVRADLARQLEDARRDRSAVEKQLLQRSRSPQELATLRGQFAERHFDQLKLEGQIRANELTYRAPTLDELAKQGIKKGERVNLTVTVGEGVRKTSTQLQLVAE